MPITISQLKKKVDFAKKGTEQETARIILEFEQQILDLVREKQLYDKGIDGKGVSLKPYSPFTVAYKKGKGDKFSNTTLEDTGNFYKSFQTDYGSFELEIFATDSKTPKLTEVYGENIFLITTENQKELSEKIIRPNLFKYFDKIFK